MKTYKVQDLFTIKHKTGLQFNYDGNVYNIANIEDDERQNLVDLIETQLPVAEVIMLDTGFVVIKTAIENEPIIKVEFEVELTDYYLTQSERERRKSKQAVHSFMDEVVYFINRLSIERYGLIVVANWADGGSDANVVEIHTPDEFLIQYPAANKQEVDMLFSGRRDGFPIRLWTDEQGRIVSDRIYYAGDLAEEDDNEVFYVIEDSRHSLSISLAIKPI